MSTGAIVAVSVVGVAAVGAGVYFFVIKPKKAAAAKKPTSTTDKVVGTVSALIPVANKIIDLFD